jgi:hypothetical protein
MKTPPQAAAPTMSANHTSEEFSAAYLALEDLELIDLRRASTGYAVIARMDVDELIGEAFARVYGEQRIWPRHVAIIPFLLQVFRSVASGKRNGERCHTSALRRPFMGKGAP